MEGWREDGGYEVKWGWWVGGVLEAEKKWWVSEWGGGKVSFYEMVLRLGHALYID